MAGHSHDDHHITEQKPVSFTVPFILAAVTILIMVLFLSLCDPKAHDSHHGVENPAHSKFKGETDNVEEIQGQERSHGAGATAADSAGTHVPENTGGAHQE